MIRAIDKEKFRKLICDRPSLIRKLVNPTTNFIADCLFSNLDCFQYVDSSLITLPVLNAYIDFMKKYSSVKIRLDRFPSSLLIQVNEKRIRKLYDIEDDTVKCFPHAPYELWLKYLSDQNNHCDFKDIPVAHRTEELIVHRLCVRSGYSNEIPEEVLTDPIVDKAIKLAPEVVNNLPDKFKTAARLRTAFTQDPHIELSQGVEDIVQDQPLADLICKEKPLNMKHIAPAFRTWDICMRAVNEESFMLSEVPSSILDEGIIIQGYCSGNVEYGRHTSIAERIARQRKGVSAKHKKILTTKGILFKLAEKDFERAQRVTNRHPDLYGLVNYLKETSKVAGQEVTPEDWLKILKVNPYAIKLIEKSRQTDAMMQTFIETASLDIIDASTKYLNLAKIKKEHCTLLVGTHSQFLQDIITRKGNPKPKQSHKAELKKLEREVVASLDADTVSVELSDGDYRDVLQRIGG